jgi:hypothetical protein
MQILLGVNGISITYRRVIPRKALLSGASAKEAQARRKKWAEFLPLLWQRTEGPRKAEIGKLLVNYRMFLIEIGPLS